MIPKPSVTQGIDFIIIIIIISFPMSHSLEGFIYVSLKWYEFPESYYIS